jgi:hypothetical protein
VIVLGGPEISGLVEAHSPADSTDIPAGPEEMSALFRYADFVIRGEGEVVFTGLCRTLLKDPCHGIAAAKKQYGKFITADPVDPAALKGAYDLYTGDDLQNKLIYVEASRGCPYACAFCQSAVKPGSSYPAVREFPLEPFLAELENLLQRLLKAGTEKKRTLKFLDRSFNVHIPRALRILEFCLTKITELKNEYEKRLQFHFEMVPSVFPIELRKTLTRFPPESIRLEIGIQSFNPRTCALINRASNPEQELEVLRFLREETTVILHVDLMAGLPGEDLASFGRGFDRLWTTLSGGGKAGGNGNTGNSAGGDGKNSAVGNAVGEHPSAPFEIQVGILKCLPGTAIHAMAEGGGFTYNKTAPYEVIETDCLSKADMEKIKNFARFWEYIVNRRNFPRLLPHLVPPGLPVFDRFMELSEKLLCRFGKNWGIPKQEMELYLQSQ